MPYQEFRLGAGLNLKAAPDAIADNELQEALGCRFDTEGAVSSALGRREIRDLGSQIRGTVDAYDSLGLFRITKAGTTLYQDGTSIGTFSGTGQLTGFSYNGYAYLTDGTNIKRKSRSGALEAIGLDAPSTTATAAETNNGVGNLADGTYKYVITFDNGVAESNFSAEASVTIAAGPSDVALTAIPTGGASVLKRHIYRTDKGGTAKFFITTLADNTTTTYTDTGALPAGADANANAGDTTTDEKDDETAVAGNKKVKFKYDPAVEGDIDQQWLKWKQGGQTATTEGKPPEVVMTNLGVLANWNDHDTPPTDLKHLVFHYETAWAISGNSVRFTLLGQPEHWSFWNEFPVGRQTGETLVAIEPFGQNKLTCYTDSNVYFYEIVGSDPSDGRLVDTHSPVGLLDEFGVFNVKVGAQDIQIFRAATGLYAFDGQSVAEVSFAVEPLFTDSTHADYISPSTVTYGAAKRDKGWLSYGSKTLFVDFQNPQAARYAVLPYGFTSLAIEKKNNRLIAGDSAGKLYELDVDVAESVAWAPKSKRYSFGAPTRNKHLSELVLDADLGGLSTTITVTSDTGRTTNWTEQSSGRKRIRRYLPTTMEGRSFDVKVSSTGNAARHLYGVGFNVEGGAAP